MKTTLTRMEKIICPYCGAIELAQNRRIDGWPYFAVLVNECGVCGHIIGESEWQPLEEEHP